MNNSPPRPSMGRGRGTPNRKKPPDKQKSKGQAAIEAQWATDPDLNQTFDSGRITTENRRSPRRNRDNFQSSGVSPPSKSQKPNNKDEELFQQVRANLRPTFSTENSPTRTGSQRAHLLQNSGQASSHPIEPSDHHSREGEPQTAGHSRDGTYETADVIITSKNEGQNFGRISVVRVSRALRTLVSTYSFKVTSITTIKVTLNVNLLPNLEGIDLFCGIPVDIAVATSSGPRDFTWGKFYSQDLFYSTDEEILEELQEENENIIFVKRLYRGSEKAPTRLIKVKFQSIRRPEYVFCLGSAYQVTEYLPPVKRCFKCHSYSHFTSTCENTPKCKNCNLVHPDTNVCNNEARCAHCGPGHASDDPTCPKYIKEREIVAISYEKNVSYETARNEVTQGETSYASKLKLKANSSQAKNIPTGQTSTNTGTGTTLTVETKNASTGRQDSNISMENEIEQTLETPDEEQPHSNKIIYGRKPKKLPAWMVLVSEMTRALTNAVDLEEFRTNFASIIEDIDTEINSDIANNTVTSIYQGSHSIS